MTVKAMQGHAYAAALKAAGQPCALPRAATAVLDTGAAISCLDPSIVTDLALQPHGQIAIHTPSTGPAFVLRNTYDATLVIQAGPEHLEKTIQVVETELASQGFHVLLGRNFLRHCTLTYDGPSIRFTLDW